MDDRFVFRQTRDADVQKASEEQADYETNDLEEDSGGHA